MLKSDTSIVEQIFAEIANIVTPTMGGKGMLAVINDEFGRPILTDDGVTVAKQCIHFDGLKRMPALSMIEAAHNTEKKAFDGTTLTILLTNEIYKKGMQMIRTGKHPQTIADLLAEELKKVRELLKEMKIDMKDEHVYPLASISTKIPLVAELVEKAYHVSEKTMNILIEHDRKNVKHSVERTAGMALDHGYHSENLRQLCNQNGITVFNHAHIVLLNEGGLTPKDMNNFFNSIPDQATTDPFVFVLPRGFNPESLNNLLNTLVENKMKFQVIFLNENRLEELFLDIAAYTGAMIQDAAHGTQDYSFDHVGFVDSISIEQHKSIMYVSDPNDHDIQARIEAYNKELEDKVYATGMNRAAEITERLANLQGGITKIKVAVDTITEYLTLKLKLDDAIGATRCAIREGILPGSNKPLYLLAEKVPVVRRILRQPIETILTNAGISINKLDGLKDGEGIDVKGGQKVDLLSHGIIDSYSSIDTAIANASSIACQYLRAFIVISKE